MRMWKMRGHSKLVASAASFCLLCCTLNGCAQELLQGHRATDSIGQNCGLSVPPITSGKNAVHGAYLFIYPRELPDNYSGCQTMWEQTGRKWMVLHLNDGHPTKLVESYVETAAKPV